MAVIFLFGSLVAFSAAPAYARVRGHISIGVTPFFYYPYAYPYAYPYGYYYPYPRYYYYEYFPQSPDVVEQPAAPSEPAPSYWYFCQSANAYYPYVSHCPEGWRAVPTTPPPPSGTTPSDKRPQ